VLRENSLKRTHLIKINKKQKQKKKTEKQKTEKSTSTAGMWKRKLEAVKFLQKHFEEAGSELGSI